MKYGQLAGNSSINTLIYRCFEQISEADERKFVKKFRRLPQDSDEIMHTFRELILGTHLCSHGFRARYEYAVDKRTPDWVILDPNSRLIGVVELTNFHIDAETDTEIEKQRRDKGMALVWRDENKDNVTRLYHSIERKAQVYRDLIQRLRVAYIVAVFGEFRAAIDEEEIALCLFKRESGLFQIYPEISGILFFGDRSGRFLFRYFPNPGASCDLLGNADLLSGPFPSE